MASGPSLNNGCTSGGEEDQIMVLFSLQRIGRRALCIIYVCITMKMFECCICNLTLTELMMEQIVLAVQFKVHSATCLTHICSLDNLDGKSLMFNAHIHSFTATCTGLHHLLLTSTALPPPLLLTLLLLSLCALVVWQMCREALKSSICPWNHFSVKQIILHYKFSAVSLVL